MPQRRTEVVIVIKPKIDWSEVEGREITVPIRPAPEAGRRPAAGRDGARDPLTMLLGGAMAARVGAGIRAVGTAIKALGPYALYVAAAVAAIAVAIGGMVAQGWLAVKVLQQVGKVGQAGLRLLWEGVKKAGEGFVWLAQTAIQLSIDALQRFMGWVEKIGSVVARNFSRFMRNAVTMAADFEQNIRNAVTVMGQFGEQGDIMFAKLAKGMRDITLHSRKMASEAGAAAYEVASAGFGRLVDVIDMVRGSIVLAEATLSDVVITARTMVATMNQYSLAANQATRVANLFVAAITKSPATLIKLTQSLEYAGPIAHSFGISLEETVAALMGFYRQGRTGSRAGTEFRIMLASLAKQTDKATSVLKELGLDITKLSPARVGIIGIVKAFEQLRQKVGQIKTVEAIYRAFPVRAASAMVALLGEGSAQLSKMQREITNTNLAFKIQQDQLKTLAGQWDILRSKWEEIYLRLSAYFIPALTRLVVVVQDMVKALWESGAVDTFGRALAYVTDVAADLVRQYGPELVGFLNELVISFGKLLPVAVGAFVAVLRYLEQPIKDFLTNLPDIAQQIVEKVIPALVKLATSVLPKLLDFAELVLPKLIELFTKFGETLADLVIKHGDAAIRWFKLLLTTGSRLLDFLDRLAGSQLVEDFAESFLYWGQVIAQLATSSMPLLEYAAYALVGALNQLAAIALPILLKGLELVRPLLVAFATSVLPAIVSLLRRFGALAITLMPVVANIILKAMTIGVVALQTFGKMLVSLGPLIFQAAEWLDKNFYRAVAVTMDIVAELAGTLSVLLPQALVILGLAVAPIIPALWALAIVFAVIQFTGWVIVRTIWLIVEGLKALGLIKTTGFELLLEQWAGGLEDSLKMTWRFIRGIGYDLPAAVGAGTQAASIGLDKMKDAAEGAADAAREAQRQQEAMGRSGYGGYGGGYGTPAAGGGYFGPQLAPAGYAGAGRNYQTVVGPIYVNDINQVGRVAQSVVDNTAQRNDTALRLGATILIPGAASTIAAYRYLRR